MAKSNQSADSSNCEVMESLVNMSVNQGLTEDWLNSLVESESNSWEASPKNSKITINTDDIPVEGMVQTSEHKLDTGREKEAKYFCKSCDKYYNDFIGWNDHHNRSHKEFNKSHKVLLRDKAIYNELEEVNCSESKKNVKDGNPSIASVSMDKKEDDIDPGFKVIYPISIKHYQCPACDKAFLTKAGKTTHYRLTHSVVKFSNKCLECDVVYEERDEFRNHLQDHHNLDMTPVIMRFSRMEDFLTWKSNVERETLTTYHRKTGTADTSRYYCSRSGRNYPSKTCKNTENNRMSRMRDSIKLGIACTAEIRIEKIGKGVRVKYFPVHYGHGKERVLARLSLEEQAAVDELTSKGVSFSKLLKDIIGGEPVDVTQMFPIKKRYLRWVKYGYEAEEYNTDISDPDCVSQWVQMCCQMEECPVLLCQQENIGWKNEKFILVIMTEFQKHIFMSASKQIICVDTVQRVSDAHLLAVLVMDELGTAFPVAFCITNKLNKDVMTQFFTCIKESTGKLSPKYLMSNHNLYIYESWVEVMNDRPQLLWSRWDTELAIKAHLRIFIKGNDSKRCKLYNTVQTILDCKSEDVFECMFRNFVNNLRSDEKFEKLGDWIIKRLGSDTEKWANCYRQEIDFRTILHFEMMHHTFFTVCTMGKRKRLYTFLSVLMKVLRHKMLDRILNSFDEEKLSLAVNAIDLCHVKGIDISLEQISSLSDKLWKIELEDSEKVYVTREIEKCPDHCSLRCKECNICVHQYSCSCQHNMIDANLCMHIHAVVFKFLGPLKVHCPSPSNEEDAVSQTSDSASVEDKANVLVQPASHLPQPPVIISTPRQPYIPKCIPSHFEADTSISEHDLTQLETSEPTNHVVLPPSSILRKTNKNLTPLEIALRKSMELSRRIRFCNLSKESLASINKHLNVCLDITKTNRSKYVTRAPKTIPINAIYVIKPRKKVLELVSAPKRSCKRSASSLLESNTRTKLPKTNESVTHSPHVLVISSKESDSETNA